MKKPLLIWSTASIALCLGFGGYAALHDALPSQTGNSSDMRANDFTSRQTQTTQDYTAWVQQQMQQEAQQQQQAIQQQEQAVQQEEQEINQWQQQQSGLQSQVSTQQTNQPTSTVTSLPSNTEGSGNWAGYIDSPTSNSNSYTSVTGNWTVPNISGSQNGVAAQWIGLGGVSSGDLLQMGTIEQFVNGQAEADVFWEKLPASAKNVMTVPVGSTINASISKASGSTWNITFSAHTPSGQTKTKTIPVTISSAYAQGIGTSAEWISEDPSDENNNLYPLANMGQVTYSNATVNGQAMTASGNQVQPVALIGNGNNVLIAPSSIGTDGQSFSTNPVSTNTVSGESGRRGHFSRRHFGGRGSNGNVPQFGYGYGFSGE